MALERGGLVEKTAHPGDGRSVRLDLSPAGRALLERDGMAGVGQALASLPPERQAALREGLAALVEVMLSVRRGRAFGLCRECRHFGRDMRGPDAHFCRLLGQPLEDYEGDQICQEQEAA
jgi:hypothetical protein